MNTVPSCFYWAFTFSFFFFCFSLFFFFSGAFYSVLLFWNSHDIMIYLYFPSSFFFFLMLQVSLSPSSHGAVQTLPLLLFFFLFFIYLFIYWNAVFFFLLCLCLTWTALFLSIKRILAAPLNPFVCFAISAWLNWCTLVERRTTIFRNRGIFNVGMKRKERGKTVTLQRGKSTVPFFFFACFHNVIAVDAARKNFNVLLESVFFLFACLFFFFWRTCASTIF